MNRTPLIPSFSPRWGRRCPEAVEGDSDRVQGPNAYKKRIEARHENTSSPSIHSFYSRLRKPWRVGSRLRNQRSAAPGANLDTRFQWRPTALAAGLGSTVIAGSMKITEGTRNTTPTKASPKQRGAQERMEAKSKEFVEKGAELHAKV